MPHALNRAFYRFAIHDTARIYLNVHIEAVGDDMAVGSEGCLSVPGKTGTVTRPNHVKIRAYDENMEEFELEGEELLARAILHENDHLDGHLYVEKVEGELFNTADISEEEDN